MGTSHSSKEYTQAWAARNKERRRAYARVWYRNQKDKNSESYQNSLKVNHENRLNRLNNDPDYERQSYLKHRDKYRVRKNEYNRQYRTKNKEKIRVVSRLRERNRLKNDPNFKLKKYLRIRLRQALKGKTKSCATLQLLGCTVEELWLHLESKFTKDMTRENYGKWHVDHIRPCVSFDLTDPEQQKQCFHYSNLQPLWAIDNIKKGHKYYCNHTLVAI